MPGWIPKIQTLQEQLDEEDAKAQWLADRKQQQRQAQVWKPPEEFRSLSEMQPEEPVPQEVPQWQPMSQEQPREFTPLQSIRTIRTPEMQQATPEVAEVPEEQKALWEQPAVWAEKAQQGIGQALSHVPLLPKALEKVAPVFEWAHQNIEKPWAAMLTSPWSPSLPWQAGESWVQHEKREYDAWKAPTYVKGLAEFSMPLWWMPWFGWTAKGARALGLGAKAGKAIATVGQPVKVALPSKELLNASFKPDVFRNIAIWSKNRPVIGRVVEALGGSAAFVRAESNLPQDTVLREVVNRARLRDMAGSVQNLMLPRLQKFGNPIQVLDIADDGLMRSVTALKSNASKYLYDVLEHPADYKFATKEAKAYVDELHKVLGEVRELAAKEGIAPPKNISVHRIVVGKETEKGFEKSDFGSLFERERHYDTMEQGVKAGVKYGINPNESIASTIRHEVRRIADKRFADEVKSLGKTPLEKFAENFPEEAAKITDITEKIGAHRYAMDALKKVVSYQGAGIPGAVLHKIRNALPGLGNRIDDAFALSPANADKILMGMSAEIRKVIKIKPKEFKILLNDITSARQGLFGQKKILMSDLDDAIRHLNISNDVAARAIEKGYRQAYRMNKDAVRDTLKSIQADAKNFIETSKGDLQPLLAGRRDFLQKYKYGGQILGEYEKMTNAHPSFRGLVFDRDVADTIDKAFGDQGAKWVRDMGAIGAVSRTLTASLDFSAPFIQGLPTLGRNPLLWAKATAKQFEFFAKPENLTKYLASPEAMAIRAERVVYGGATTSFEYFEALAPMQQAIFKVPKVGKLGEAAIRQTFGRSEAAFTGFAEVARNEMWKALRKPKMSDVQLQELSRTLDRMTGVMSTEALAIGRTQRDIESAWVFFAPRYTRASLSFVGDMFKGGMTGAEARQSLGALAAGGMAMYVGVSKVLGQQPNFDPTSGKFMTIKIGDEHVGLGSMLYSLTRLGANLATVESPTDLLKIDRFDNPFLNFMYSKSAPLTGLAVGLAIEHKDYLGRPFESPADWGKFLVDKVTPISLQSVMPWEEVKTSPAVFAATELGARTFPKSPSEFRDEARDRYAKEQFGVPYKALPELQQDQIDRQPDVKKLSDEADQRALKLGRGDSVAFVQRRQERDDARFVYEDNLNMYQKAVDDGIITPYEFREYLQTEGQRLGATYEHIDRQPRYKGVLEKLNNPKNVNPKFIGDIAYDELMAASFSNKFEENGIFNFAKYDQFKESLKAKYGEDVYNYILQRQAENRTNLPPLAQEYYHAKEVLRPYWKVRDEGIKIFGEPKTKWQNQRLDAFVEKMHKRLRAQNKEIDKYIRMFYTRP